MKDIFTMASEPAFSFPMMEVCEDSNPEIAEMKINYKFSAVMGYEVIRKDEDSVTLKVNNLIFKKPTRIG